MYVVTPNVIWANQKAESFVYRWLSAHVLFYINVLSSICRSTGRHFKRYVYTVINIVNDTQRFDQSSGWPKWRAL